ncbi:MAG: zinc-dependent alcohol dehydrogenase [Candidatus Helarchaeota archaeon]
MQLITRDEHPLPELMQAVVLRKPYHLEYMRIPIWPIAKYKDPDLILIKVKACGVCGSDFRYYRGENPWAQHTTGRKIMNPPNIVLGHEYAGEVVAVLSVANQKWLGKYVAPICSKVCGICEMCRTNRAHLCENTIHIGHGQGWGVQSYYPGAYAEYAPAWAPGCYELPSTLSFEEAAMMDVLAVSTHAYQRNRHIEELPLLIMGAGPVGNGIGQVAQNRGVDPSNIFILENSAIAIEIAKKTGFHQIINPSNISKAAILEHLLQLTNRKKFYSIFDCVGTEFSFNLGMKLLDKGGTFVNLAVHNRQLQNFNQMHLASERALTTSSNFSLAAYEQAWKWLCQGNFKLNSWFRQVGLSDIPKIFKETIKNKKKREYFKLLITKEL